MRREARMLVLLAASASAACAPRPRMCTASSDCATTSACVAGRCQVEKATMKPAVDSTRRVVARPVDVGYLQRGAGVSGGALPPVFVLGKASGRLLLRFSVRIPSHASVVEAYVVLHRSTLVDDDPVAISLHATRIVESWQGGSVSWARQPRLTETRSPSTLVEPSGSRLVRLDVRELVRQWARHDPADHGIAIVAEDESATGTTFALSGLGAERTSDDVVGRVGVGPFGAAPDVEPYLEVYVR